ARLRSGARGRSRAPRGSAEGDPRGHRHRQVRAPAAAPQAAGTGIADRGGPARNRVPTARATPDRQRLADRFGPRRGRIETPGVRDPLARAPHRPEELGAQTDAYDATADMRRSRRSGP